MIDFDKTIKKSFTIDFCQRLEFHLSQAFLNSRINKFECVWCDGVEVPGIENQHLEDFTETKQIVTGVWIGLTGQDKYEVIIKLGMIHLKNA